jgi:hypothetical protein
MPAKRLPWVKLYAELLEHEKFSELNDTERWTWVCLLLKASQQPQRWRFASARHAAGVTGRPAKHITALIKARLLDQHDDSSLWIHDAVQWQDRHPSDFDRGTDEPSDGRPERSAKTPRKLREDSAHIRTRLRLRFRLRFSSRKSTQLNSVSEAL